MNYAIVFKLQSVILGAIAFAFALSIGVAYLHGNANNELELTARNGFTFSFLIAATLSAGCFILGRTGNNKLFRKEALATIGIGWILASLVGAIPYYLILPDVSYASSLFESASGLTTTGASVLSDLERLPRSLHFWRAISQWMGGLGVVVFFVAVLSFLGAGAKVLFSRESSAQAAELDTSRVQQGVFRLVKLYLGISVLCAGAYWIAGLDVFESVVHMFTTVSTGGFSTRSGSIADFNNPLLEWFTIGFMILGGTSFLMILKFWDRDWVGVRNSSEVKAYYAILLAATLLMTLLLFLDTRTNDHFPDMVRSAAFQVASIMTTTGYATRDFDLWLPVTHILLLALMMVGGCSGSTAGGTKVIRFVVAWKVCSQHIERAYRSRVIRPLNVNGRNLKLEEQEAVTVYLVMLGMIIFSATLLLSFLEPSLSFQGSLSAMTACLFNIGPGFAEVGPTRNFAFLHQHTQVFLAFLMILGRLELYALLALFAPSLWRRF